MRRFRTALAAVIIAAGAAGIAVSATTAGATGSILTDSTYITGTEIGAWETDGGPALTNPAVTSEVTALGAKTVRYAAYDCFTDETCGTDNHAGTQSRAAFENTIAGITGTLHAVPWIKLLPIAAGNIGGITGTVFCPAPGNWGMNLAMDEQELAAVAAVYAGPIVVESANEPEYDCYKAWGFSSAGSAGMSTDIAHMWSATMPALKAYARSLGFSEVVTAGYIGVNGGPQWGQACTANSSAPYGYQCAVPNRWIDEFNTQVHSDYVAAGNNPDYIPDVESVHSYCHSPDFAAAPFTFSDNECYAFQREWLTNSRAQADSIWGAATGDSIRFAVSEWQAGVCESSSDCWSGWGTAGAPGSYDDGYLSMLAGNGVTTGSGTAYWGANMFEVASNCSGTAAAYNIVNCDGTLPADYANVKADFLAIDGTPAPAPSATSPTPTPVTTSPSPVPATTSPSPTPTPTRKHRWHR